jgi:hypothetical protein
MRRKLLLLIQLRMQRGLLESLPTKERSKKEINEGERKRRRGGKDALLFASILISILKKV